MTTMRYRLHGLLRVVERDRPLRQLTPRLARELLDRRRAEVVTDTQVGELAAVTRAELAELEVIVRRAVRAELARLSPHVDFRLTPTDFAIRVIT